MRIHLAGLCCQSNSRKFFAEGIAPKYILESFFYLDAWLFETPGFKTENFMLDSGAFTFLAQKKKEQIDWDAYVEKYARLIVERGIEFFFELDIDPIVGLREVERLRAKLERLTGKKCIPVFHKSRGREYWLDMISEYDYVAIGGLVTKEIKVSEHKFLSWFLETARRKKVKVHGLGFTSLNGLKSLRFHSVDSTSWVGSRYAKTYTFFNGEMKLIHRHERTRMKNYEALDRQNFSAWIKFQKYAEQNY